MILVSQNRVFRPDIQGLRASAIVLVVLAHAGVPGLPGGFVGVDVFFVLSGYLITGLLVDRYFTSGKLQIATFIARRLKRLLPALIVMLSLVMALSVWLLSNHEFVEQTASVGFAATWTSNLFFAFTNSDYFAELRLRDLFLHTWSLGVEEQFYLVWPILLALVSIISKPRFFGLGYRECLLVVLGLLFVGSLALSVYWTVRAPDWAFYLMPSRVWQFALGAIVFLWFEVSGQEGRRPRATNGFGYASMLGGIGLVMIFGSAVMLTPDIGYPGLWAVLPSIGAACVILAGSLSRAGWLSNLLSNTVMVWIGDRSYSWYLWHWPLLMLGFAWGLQEDWSAIIALILLSLGIAHVSYLNVELPFWKGEYSGSSTGKSILVAVAVIGVVAGSLAFSNQLHRDSMDRGVVLARTARNDAPRLYGQGCDTWYTDSAVMPCGIGSVDAPRTAILIGDSIGVQWFSAFAEIFGLEGWRVVVFTKSSCAIVDEDYHYGPAGGVYTVCREWRDEVLDRVAEYEPDVVFLGSATTYGFSEEQWVEGTKRVLDRLTVVSDEVVLIPGTPSLTFDGPGCLERWLSANDYGDRPTAAECRINASRQWAMRVVPYLEEAASDFDNAEVLNLNEVVCPGGHCSARSTDGVVVFRDQQHLTDSFVRSRAGAVKERLVLMELRALKGRQ